LLIVHSFCNGPRCKVAEHKARVDRKLKLDLLKLAGQYDHGN
jgi:hypothetical protein